ncbi:MAG: DUF1992 domain-containing protein [Chloroflexota bacterium]|nr:DUF1992 domain-containing protein [Chloroflexota bacterium]
MDKINLPAREVAPTIPLGRTVGQQDGWRVDRYPSGVDRPHEPLIERQIREACEAGQFDDLPFRGERIPLEDDGAAGDWALAHRILKNANMVPPWIATDREIRELLTRRDRILTRALRSSEIGRERDRRELRRVVEDANRAIAILNNEAPTNRQHRRGLDLATELAALARRHAVDGESG